jgi:thioredoxin 1
MIESNVDMSSLFNTIRGNHMQNTHNPITIGTFDENVIQNEKPVVVFFWAAWCAPCLTMLSIIKEIIVEQSEFDLFSANTDEEPTLASLYGIRTIPGYVIFQNGRAVISSKNLIGSMSKERLLKMVREKITI